MDVTKQGRAEKRRKTRFETVLHTLFICESQRSLLSMVIPKDGVLTLDQFSPRLERDRVVRVTERGRERERRQRGVWRGRDGLKSFSQ